MLGEALSLSAAVFRVDTDNARVTNSSGATDNVGQKRIQGLEVGVNGEITDAWSVFAGYTYLDSEVVKAGVTSGILGLNDGIQFPNTPEHSASTATINSTKYIPDYTRVDANATYVINDQLNLRLNVQNLTDEFYFSQAYPTHYATVAPGRSATLTLNFRY